MAFDFPFVKEALTQLFKKSSCEEYPFKPKEAPLNYRGRIVFHGDKCIRCGLCEKVCAGGAIANQLIGENEDEETYERSFFLGSCTFCNFCADFCSTNAIELTRDFHMTATDPEDLIVKGVYVRKKKKKVAKEPAAPKAAAPKAEEPKAEEACKTE